MLMRSAFWCPQSGLALLALSVTVVFGLADTCTASESTSEASAGPRGPHWIDFATAWDQPLPAPVGMANRVLDAPAGKHGPIRAQGERLVFEDGTPVRLWGVGIVSAFSAGPDAVPPPKAAAAKLANKLASLGFNHVRLVGFDGNSPEAIKAWRKTGRVQSSLLDRLDYFINELRKRGIYYSFSMNSSTGLFADSDIVPPNSVTMPFQHYRTVRLFHPRAQEEIAAWTRAFFKHRNPYTGLTYAEDPANVYFSLVNEDTAFLGFYGRYRSFSDQWVDLINKQFARYLAQRYKSQDDLASAWRQPLHAGLLPGENLQENRVELRSMTPWPLVSDARKRDTADFLLSLDTDLARQVNRELSAEGYSGLFTHTNKWYGIGNLYAAYASGDYIEGHVYFGSGKPEKKNSAVLRMENLSYLDRMSSGPKAMAELLQDSRFFLSRVLPANLVDRPYIVSEWNDMIWGDYAYEGPFLLAALGARMGIDGMDLHILYDNPRTPYTNAVPKSVFTVMGNPLLTAILPSLGLAYQRGDIAPAETRSIVCLGRDRSEVLTRALEPPRVDRELQEAILKNGAEHVRTAFGEACDASEDADTPRRPGADAADDAVSWSAATSGKGRLMITTERFEAIVGDLENTAEGSRVLSADMAHPGSVSAISLDGAKLSDSRCMLVTVAGPIRNEDSQWHYDGAEKIVDIGTRKPQLRGNVGTLSLDLVYDPASERSVWAVRADGGRSELRAEEARIAGRSRLDIDVGNLDAPWLVVGSRECLRADALQD